MVSRSFIVIYLLILLTITACFKETYDMNKLSKEAHISPTWAVSAVTGDVSLSDLVDANDTLVFDENNLVKFVFREDSIINFLMTDFYDLNDMVSFNQTYPIGVLSIDPFQGTVTHSLNQISVRLGAPYTADFASLDGTTDLFPSFPSVDMLEVSLPLFPNLDNALFYSGAIDVTIKNNLTAPISGATIKLYNNSGHIQIGPSAIISLPVQPGDSIVTPIDLEGISITNSMNVSVIIAGSPGTSTAVPINLNTDNVKVRIRGRDLRVLSGRVILPLQRITTLDNKDTVNFDPGPDVEIDEFKIVTGNLSYTIQSASPATEILSITLPTALVTGVPVSKAITVDPLATETGTIPVSNSTVDMGTDLSQPFNRLPLEYTIDISSDNTKIDFIWSDEIEIDMELLSPVFDYVKGYFGQQEEEIESDTLKLEIEEIMQKVTGEFLISSPSIRLNYSNSFAIPIEMTLEAEGYKTGETVDLNMDPFTLSYPVAPANRDIEDVFAIDKTNSNLPELISIPPEEIRFGGSAVMNPDGNDGSRNNYIFNDSRFIGALEIEVPLEFRMTNLMFNDTTDNFLAEAFGDGDDLNWDDFELFRIDFEVKNGFPLGISLELILLDSITHQPVSSIDATDLLEPAPVDNAGKATGTTISSTSITFTQEFFNSINSADEIIFSFTLNTTDNGTKDVKIYSDYRIDFKASLVLKPDYKFDLK